jgi:hypothetical protein
MLRNAARCQAVSETVPAHAAQILVRFSARAPEPDRERVLRQTPESKSCRLIIEVLFR